MPNNSAWGWTQSEFPSKPKPVARQGLTTWNGMLSRPRRRAQVVNPSDWDVKAYNAAQVSAETDWDSVAEWSVDQVGVNEPAEGFDAVFAVADGREGGGA